MVCLDLVGHQVKKIEKFCARILHFPRFLAYGIVPLQCSRNEGRVPYI